MQQRAKQQVDIQIAHSLTCVRSYESVCRRNVVATREITKDCTYKRDVLQQKSCRGTRERDFSQDRYTVSSPRDTSLSLACAFLSLVCVSAIYFACRQSLSLMCLSMHIILNVVALSGISSGFRKDDLQILGFCWY